jgi:pimeloyl-ACP methyl ester carboxylesterase
MAFVDASGVRLYVEDVGHGYPIVFVHELAADTREWEGQLRYFARNFRCVAFNARGYKPSDVPREREKYGYEFAVDDIAAVMDGLGIRKAHIVGLSMGAYATLCFGLRYPERASALVVAGVGSGSPTAEHESFVVEHRAMADAVRREGTEGVAKLATRIGGIPTRVRLEHKDPLAWQSFMAHLAEHDAVGMANTMEMFQGGRPSLEDFREALSRLELPVLLAVGDEDSPCLETNLFLKRTIPNARLWVVPNTGHSINLEEPVAFNTPVQSFFDDVARAELGRLKGKA